MTNKNGPANAGPFVNGAGLPLYTLAMCAALATLRAGAILLCAMGAILFLGFAAAGGCKSHRTSQHNGRHGQ
jgi:hypothetical protein